MDGAGESVMLLTAAALTWAALGTGRVVRSLVGAHKARFRSAIGSEAVVVPKEGVSFRLGGVSFNSEGRRSGMIEEREEGHGDRLVRTVLDDMIRDHYADAVSLGPVPIYDTVEVIKGRPFLSRLSGPRILAALLRVSRNDRLVVHDGQVCRVQHDEGDDDA